MIAWETDFGWLLRVAAKGTCSTLLLECVVQYIPPDGCSCQLMIMVTVPATMFEPRLLVFLSARHTRTCLQARLRHQ